MRWRGIRHAPGRWRVAPAQRAWLAGHPPAADRLVIFLTADVDGVNGGMLSISSLAEESEALVAPRGAKVYLCPYPEGRGLLRYTRFDNPHTLVDLNLLLRAARPGAELLFQVPEVYTAEAVGFLARAAARGFRIRSNILLQNIDFIPPREAVARLAALGPVTATTAHRKYATEETARRLGCPVRHLSVWACPERFDRVPEARKDPVLMVSPDRSPRRAEVQRALAARLPWLEQVVVRGLAYREYRALAARARHSLTFGEGLDGYFVETVFSGGVGLAVYNERFFTPAYRGLPGLYASWEQLLAQAPEDVERWRDPAAYAAAHRRQFDQLAADYRRDEYLANLERFYQSVWPRPAA